PRNVTVAGLPRGKPLPMTSNRSPTSASLGEKLIVPSSPGAGSDETWQPAKSSNESASTARARIVRAIAALPECGRETRSICPEPEASGIPLGIAVERTDHGRLADRQDPAAPDGNHATLTRGGHRTARQPRRVQASHRSGRGPLGVPAAAELPRLSGVS